MLHKLQGCLVQPCDPGIPPPKILQVRLTPEIFQSLLKNNGNDISISFDQEMQFSVGSSKHPFNMTPETSMTNIYSFHKANELAHIGAVSHRITVRRQLGSSVSERLKSRQAQEAAAKQERSVQTFEAVDSNKKKNTKLPATTRHISSAIRSDSPVRHTSSFLQARKSPLLVASSPRLNPIPLQIRLAQALALGATSEKELSTRLKAPVDAVAAVLQEVAHSIGENWVLNDAQFEHLKIWDWKGYTTSERQAVISRAAEAFDRLNLDQAHASRMKLLHPDKRKADLRDDTSPLSLNDSISTSDAANALLREQIQPEAKDRSDNKATGLALVAITSPKPDRKIVANGLLSMGTRPEKKRRVGYESKVEDAHPNKQRSSRSGTALGQCSSKVMEDTKSKEPMVFHSSTHQRNTFSDSHNSCSKDSTSRSKLQASPSVSPEKDQMRKAPTLQSLAVSPTQSQKKRPERVIARKSERLQTIEAPEASLAPSRSASASPLNAPKSDRTASMTSTCTDGSDRTILSAASTAATSISSVSSLESPKLRSKFLVSNSVTKRPLLANHGSESSAVRPKSCQTPESLSDKSKADKTKIVISKKREREETPDDSPLPNVKRVHTIDLQNMAKDYKRLYPQYRSLHAEVVSKLGDANLLSKFMELHNQMALWKQTLRSED